MPGGSEQGPSTASGQGRRFLRDNAFLVAAGLLPVLVVGFFLLATAIPRWTVPPPAYDLIVKGYKPYSGDIRLKVSYDLDVRGSLPAADASGDSTRRAGDDGAGSRTWPGAPRRRESAGWLHAGTASVSLHWYPRRPL